MMRRAFGRLVYNYGQSQQNPYLEIPGSPRWLNGLPLLLNEVLQCLEGRDYLASRGFPNIECCHDIESCEKWRERLKRFVKQRGVLTRRVLRKRQDRNDPPFAEGVEGSVECTPEWKEATESRKDWWYETTDDEEEDEEEEYDSQDEEEEYDEEEVYDSQEDSQDSQDSQDDGDEEGSDDDYGSNFYEPTHGLHRDAATGELVFDESYLKELQSVRRTPPLPLRCCSW